MASTTRRDLFAAAGATALAGIATAAIAMPETLAGDAGPDAALIAACERFVQLEQHYEQVATGEHPIGSVADRAENAAVDRIRAAQRPLIERVEHLPTRTHAGFQARARALLAWEHGDLERRAGEGYVSDRLTWAIMRDLAGVVARPAGGAASSRQQPDAELLAACSSLLGIVDGINVAGLDVVPGDPRMAEMERLNDAIMDAVPATFLGHRMRARAHLEWTGGVGRDGEPASQLDGEKMWPILRDLADAAALPVAKVATGRIEPDALLLAACARYQAAWHATEAMIHEQADKFGDDLPAAEDERQDAALYGLRDLEAEIAGYRATTHAGMAGKARVLQLADGSLEPRKPGEPAGLLWSLTMDLCGKGARDTTRDKADL